MSRAFSLAFGLLGPSLLMMQPAAASAGETIPAAVPITAADAAQVVPGVEVLATQNPQKRPLGLSTGLNQSVQDTPQVVNVIPKALIEEQKITTLEQALRDSPGITVAIGEGGTLAGDQFKIRGLDASNDIYTDGLRDFGVYTRDAFDYEAVQVLKGPSGAMFGRGTTGGAINTISKQPQAGRDFLSADASVGTGDYYRVTADLNHRIDDTTAVRLNVMGNSTGVTGRDKVGSDRWGVAGAIGFGLGARSSLVVNLLHQQDQRVPDYGIVIGAPTGVIRALPATEYGLSPKVFEQFDTDQDRTRADILTAAYKLDLAPNLVFTSDTRAATYARYFQYTSVDSCLVNAVTHQTCIDALIDGNPATKPLITFGGGGPYSQRAWGAQNISSLHGTFEVAGLKTEIVAGTDFNRQENRKAFYAYTLPPLSSGVYAPGTTAAARNAIAIDLLTGAGHPPPGYTPFRPHVTPGVPATGIPGTSVTRSSYILDSKGSADDAAGFVTDRLWFTPQVSLIAGVRYDVYSAEFENLLVSGVRQAYRSTSHLTSPRAALVYEPSDALTLYTAYAKSATPVGTAIVGSATPISGATSAFDPDEGESYEFGAKGSWLHGRLAWDAAYFHVNKSNAKMTDPTSGLISSQSSQEQTFEGAELGVQGKLTGDWSVNLAYTLIASTVRQDLACTTTAPIACYPNPVTTGTAVLQVPRNSAFLWSSYRLSRLVHGLSVAGGLTYQDGYHVRYTTSGTAPNLVLTRDAFVPYTLSVDGLIQYEAKGWRLALNLYNLTDHLNYGQSFGNRAAPAQGRAAVFTVGRSF
jgi:catecholate siderophore receptor